MPALADGVVVLGAGYVGLVTAVGLAELGHPVRLVEKAPARLAALRAGSIPIFEQDLQAAFSEQLQEGRLTVSSSLPAETGIVMVCVGTPISADGRSDLSQLKSALDDLAPTVGPTTILIVRSTLPVGESKRLARWTNVPEVRVFTNPEFLREGSALADFRAPSRIVIGRHPDAEEASLARVEALFEGVDADIEIVDVTASEIIKNGANAFLALKLSFINELAALAEESGADIGEVLVGIGKDPRIGSRYMQPGFGFGGSCLPKELQTLAVAGRAVGLAMHVTTAASHANAAHQERFVDRVASLVGGLDGKTIGLLGLAFKAGTDDVRDSPALNLARSMMASGARVVAFDPAASANAERSLPGLATVDRAESVFEDAAAVVVATEWPEFASLPFGKLRERMAEPLLIDGRRLLDPSLLRSIGYRVSVLGTGEISPTNAP